MNTSARSSFTATSQVAVSISRALRHTLCGLSLAIAANMAMQAQVPQPLESLTGKGPKARLQLTGIMQLAAKSYVSISDAYAKKTVGDWLTIGDYRAGFHVKEIAQNSVVLTDRKTGEDITLYLAGARNSEAGETGKRRKDWINSADNPMYYAPSSLPLDISRDWLNLSNEDKTQIIELYRDFGWNLIVAESVAGTTQLAWENIYENERKAATEKAKVEFEKSLNAEQQAIFAKIKATPPPIVSSGPPSAEHMEANMVRRTEWDKLRKTFTPSQREAYEAILDPRKAMQRKE